MSQENVSPIELTLNVKGYVVSSVPCPVCGTPLTLERIPDLAVVEYRTLCIACGWSGPIRQLRCGGCHKTSFFKWEGEFWRCIECNHTRGSSPPRRISQ